MNKKEQIKELNNEIQCHKKEILYHEERINGLNDKILILSGKTEICPNCDGQGKIGIGHSFRNGIIYVKCHLCTGSGRLTKEELDAQKQTT